MSKNKTIYQNLNSFLNLDGLGGADNEPQQPTQTEPKIIIKGRTPEEIHRKGLEIEQRKKLQDRFFKATDRGYQKALQYEAARLPAYIDYEGMEYYPIISSALDLYMEESTTIGLNGKMLNIYSDKDRIKNVLEDLFYDIVNVNTNLPFWCRNLVKYGDNFVHLYGERKRGITHVKQLVNYEIERYDRIKGGKPTTKFKDRMTGNEYLTFEVAHFRLLGDDKYIPYGSSLLNKVRRVFRQLVMSEDAMLTYRIIRAGEKKVFKIDVGNMDDDDIEDYIYKVATKFKKTSHINPNDGQIDYRFNILGNDEDYFLPVKNANTQTGIETLPGATNLNDIADIEYLRDNLFTGLGIPKPFLSFQDAAGGGKNMAQYDIRFAKKVVRIQQALIQELNKIAMIHLYYLGFDANELSNFNLTLTNPSIQEELIKNELLREKAQTYTELTRGENGIAAMSHTGAKRSVFNMSDDEIVTDLKQQKMEKAVMQELQDAPLIIKSTGLFKDIDDRFGEPMDGGPIGVDVPEGEASAGGGQDMGDTSDMGLGDNAPPIGGRPDMGGTPMPQLSESEYIKMVEKLVYGDKYKKKLERENKTIIIETEEKNKNLNTKAEDMISEIESLINLSEDINIEILDEDLDENLDDINILDGFSDGFDYLDEQNNNLNN